MIFFAAPYCFKNDCRCLYLLHDAEKVQGSDTRMLDSYSKACYKKLKGQIIGIARCGRKSIQWLNILIVDGAALLAGLQYLFNAPGI